MTDKYVFTPVYDEEAFEAVQEDAAIAIAIVDAVEQAKKEGLFKAFDASETLVFARQLETIKNRIYTKKYEQLKARQFVPFSRDGAAAGGNGSRTYRVYDETTMAILVGNYATNFPMVSASAQEHTVKYHHFGNAFGWSILDLRDAAKAGIALESRMAEIARRGHELAFEDEVALGVSQLKTYGLLNHPNVTITTVTTGAWGSATGQQILDDLNGLVTNMWNSTLEMYVGDTLLVSSVCYRKLATTYVNSSAGYRTVLEEFKVMNPGISVMSWTKLNTAGASGGGRMVFYKRDSEVLEFAVGTEFEILEPERRGMFVKFPCMSSAAGVQIFLPFAVQYCDNQNL
jgi:hypothetical protein